MKTRILSLALATALLCTLEATGARAQDTPPDGGAPERRGYPRDVIVAENFRYFAGGRALPVRGDEAAVTARLNAAGTAARDLGVEMISGLEVGAGYTVRVFDAPPARRVDGAPAAPVKTKLITLRPVSYRGVPLAAGSDVLSVATVKGEVLVVRERNLPRTVDGTVPSVPGYAAQRAALEAGRGNDMPADAVAGEPALEVFVDPSARGRLAWKVRVASPSLTDPWARDLWVAAIGEPSILANREGIDTTHNGHATATAWSASPLGAFPAQDLAAATVTRNLAARDTTTTDAQGRYAFGFGGGTATLTVGVSGLFSVVDNVAGGEVVFTGIGSPSAPVDLFINAAGDAQLAQTSAFIWVNHARAFVDGFLPSSALLRLRTNVNINKTCNANFDGSAVNFFAAGKGCPNTAYSDIVLHEYGHAVDRALGGKLDGGYSEGFGDALAILRTGQSCVGRDFFGPGTCLREGTDVLLWPPDTDEVHDVGQRYTGFVQALVTELQATFAPSDASEIARQLILGAAVANPSSVPDAVKLSFVVDDDDGDLENGTPHCAQLADAADSRTIPHPPCPATHVRTVADLNNDGQADIVGFGDAGVWTALSAGDGSFTPEKFVLANFGADQGWSQGRHVRTMADLDNDGRADIVAFGDAGVWTALSAGDGSFAGEKFVLADFGAQQGWATSKHVRIMADLNGDRRADIVGFGDAGVWTALSLGDGTFAPHRFVLADFGTNQGWSVVKHVRTVADLNNDGLADIVAFGFHGVWTALSAGDGTFAPQSFVLANFGAQQGWDEQHVRTVADINNDGRADIVAFGFHGVWTALSAGNGAFAPEAFVLANFGINQGWSTALHLRKLADVNGDGSADIVAFGDAGVWTALSAGNGAFAPERFVLADFGAQQAWHPSRHVRLLANINRDRMADIVAFGDAGVWTALSAGRGFFAPHRFVLANFGFEQGWRGKE